MLSNIVVGRATALQSFLLGQPQFREVLAHRNLDQLRQRITAAYHLGPLNRADTRGYIEHRLRCAGWHSDPLFEDDSFSVIYESTGGIPRRINGLCSRLLLYGFLEEIHTISASDAERVAMDLKAELSAVTVPAKIWDAVPMIAETPALPGAVAERLCTLERVTKIHQRTIQRLIEIMANHFKEKGSDDPL
jgi:hypothetical protein